MTLRNWVSPLIVITTLFTATTTLAKDYVDGQHYTTIGVPDEKNALIEYYSVLCPACYQFSSIMKKLEPVLEEKGIETEYRHVDFLGHGNKDVQQELSILTAAAYAVNDTEGDIFQEWLYNEIHQHHWHPVSTKDIWTKMTHKGVSQTVLEKANEPTFRRAMQTYFANLDEMIDKKSLKGTPTLVVNDAYRVEMGGLDKQAPFADLVALIEFLNNKD